MKLYSSILYTFLVAAQVVLAAPGGEELFARAPSCAPNACRNYLNSDGNFDNASKLCKRVATAKPTTLTTTITINGPPTTLKKSRIVIATASSTSTLSTTQTNRITTTIQVRVSSTATVQITTTPAALTLTTTAPTATKTTTVSSDVEEVFTTTKLVTRTTRSTTTVTVTRTTQGPDATVTTGGTTTTTSTKTAPDYGYNGYYGYYYYYDNYGNNPFIAIVTTTYHVTFTTNTFTIALTTSTSTATVDPTTTITYTLASTTTLAPLKLKARQQSTAFSAFSSSAVSTCGGKLSSVSQACSCLSTTSSTTQTAPISTKTVTTTLTTTSSNIISTTFSTSVTSTIKSSITTTSKITTTTTVVAPRQTITSTITPTVTTTEMDLFTYPFTETLGSTVPYDLVTTQFFAPSTVTVTSTKTSTNLVTTTATAYKVYRTITSGTWSYAYSYTTTVTSTRTILYRTAVTSSAAANTVTSTKTVTQLSTVTPNSAPSSLIDPGDFETGSWGPNWTVRSGTLSIVSPGYDGSQYAGLITTTNRNYPTYVFYKGFTVRPGEEYAVTFNMRFEGSGCTLLIQTTDGDHLFGGSEIPVPSGQWTTQKFTLVPQTSAYTLNLRPQCSANGPMVTLDNIIMRPVSQTIYDGSAPAIGSNVVSNGDFASGSLAPWKISRQDYSDLSFQTNGPADHPSQLLIGLNAQSDYSYSFPRSGSATFAMTQDIPIVKDTVYKLSMDLKYEYPLILDGGYYGPQYTDEITGFLYPANDVGMQYVLNIRQSDFDDLGLAQGGSWATVTKFFAGPSTSSQTLRLTFKTNHANILHFTNVKVVPVSN